MKHLFIWLIGFYQKYISTLKRYPTCRFSPTCSEYAIQAIKRHGAFFGMALALFRFMRCNPFFKSGYDPVPEELPFFRKRGKTKL